MVVGTLLLTVALAVGGLARSPIYRESYASPRYPAYQVYQPLPSAAPQAFPGGAGAYVPLSSYYQSNASSPPVYQPATSQPARSSYQPVLHQAVGSQYQAAEPLYQPPQPQYQPVEPQYQPVQPQYQLAEPQYQPVQAQYQPTEPQYQPAEPQYQPAQPQYQPIESQYQSQDQYGQYTFGFAGGDSARSETRGADGSVRGSYSYVDEDGQTQTQHYVADEFGFRVTGTNLPRVPEVPASAASVPAPAHEPLPTPQPVQDTPEVAAAKAAFIKAYNEAAIAAAEAPDVD
ncbi:DNA-directed RNA polymerase II subunit RPB1-like [Penaeus japonicus]|uniref:DNA-directed RNA polymerase II subunit RPB1-like n=1 Tax=Penaeus japonicus TaxID=27405 RepID=UPI001C713A38|nr:DNA-directed RNA polymerase II subunit RPB1-like [Penaeus japonicus]